ncbi:hypothetical protein BY996DRAFT_8444647 [Phakopsora pachyrhizi]|nr:hypothetical protein BY996DRAFT_8444647 [Phakopsora pachyrhizi]
MAFRSFSTSIFALKSLFLIVNPIQTWAAVAMTDLKCICHDQGFLTALHSCFQLSAKPQLGGQSSPLVLYLGAQPPLPNNSSFSTLTSTGFVSSSSGGVNVISPPAPVPARVPAQSTGYVPTTPPELAPSGSALAHSINESGVSAASPSTNAPSRVSNQTPGLAPPPAQATAQNSASLRYSSSLNKPVIMVAASSFAMLFV